MPPGGPDLCAASSVGTTGGGRLDATVGVQEMRLRGTGGAGETDTESATVRFQFRAVSTYPATIRVGVTFDGVLRGGGSDLIGGSISIEARLRDAETFEELAPPVTIHQRDTGNTLGFINDSSGLSAKVGEISHTLEHDRLFEVVLVARVQGYGHGLVDAGRADYESGNRKINYGCVTVTPDGLTDTDGDAIYDQWETSGIDIDNDGVPDWTPSELGQDFAGRDIVLDPDRKDIIVEMDWFDCAQAGGDCAAGTTHSHRPRDSALEIVREAFANAPVSNANGAADGINLWVQADQALPHRQFCDFEDGCLDDVKDPNFGTQAERGVFNKLLAKSFIAHYNLWVDRKASNNFSSGEAEGEALRPGNDFLVSLGGALGQVGSQRDQAGTFMHELGHNLGLGHGGVDNVNCKPNYFSIMSYTFQTQGLLPLDPLADVIFDYSRAAYPNSGALEEDALDETIGVQDGELTVFFGPPTGLSTLRSDWLRGDGNAPIDWDDANGAFDVPAKPTDINFLNIRGCGLDKAGMGSPDPTPDDVLQGATDWDRLIYNFRTAANYAPGVHDGQTGEDDELDARDIPYIQAQFWRARAERIGRLYRYDAKLICGLQADPEGLMLAQGRYASVINVLNPGDKPTEINSAISLAHPAAEAEEDALFRVGVDRLGPDRALAYDCDGLRERVFQGALPAAYLDGFLTILSPRKLRVSGVYTTAAVDASGQTTGHSSIEIEDVAGRDLSADLQIGKGGQALPAIAFDDGYFWSFAMVEIEVENLGEGDAVDVTVTDELGVSAVNAQAALFVLPPPVAPADLPQGGSIELTAQTGYSSTVTLSLGDILAGETATARFWLLAVYLVDNDAEDVRVGVDNVARADASGFEYNAQNNETLHQLELYSR